MFGNCMLEGNPPCFYRRHTVAHTRQREPSITLTPVMRTPAEYSRPDRHPQLCTCVALPPPSAIMIEGITRICDDTQTP